MKKIRIKKMPKLESTKTSTTLLKAMIIIELINLTDTQISPATITDPSTQFPDPVSSMSFRIGGDGIYYFAYATEEAGYGIGKYDPDTNPSLVELAVPYEKFATPAAIEAEYATTAFPASTHYFLSAVLYSYIAKHSLGSGGTHDVEYILNYEAYPSNTERVSSVIALDSYWKNDFSIYIFGANVLEIPGDIRHGYSFGVGNYGLGGSYYKSYVSGAYDTSELLEAQTMSDESLMFVAWRGTVDNLAIYEFFSDPSLFVLQKTFALEGGLELYFEYAKSYDYSPTIVIVDSNSDKIIFWNWFTDEQDDLDNPILSFQKKLTIVPNVDLLYFLIGSNEVHEMLNHETVYSFEPTGVTSNSVVGVSTSPDGRFTMYTDENSMFHLYELDQSSCDPSCKGCFKSGPDGCIECNTGVKTADNECRGDTTCPVGHFENNDGGCFKCSEGCHQCTAFGNCEKCSDDDMKILEANYCEEGPCLPAKFRDPTDTACKDCDLTCSTCENNSVNCLTCSPSYPYKNPDNTCVASCTGTYSFQNPDNSCIDSCASNMYDGGSNLCLPCDEACNGCSGSGPSACSSCAPGYSDVSGTCEIVCNPDEFLNALSVCETCHYACNGCSSPDPSECISCTNFFEDQGGICTSTCHPSCKTCSGLSSTDCASCLNDDHFLQILGNCEEGCVMGFESPDLICLPCDPDCIKCTGPSKEQCLTCSKLGMVALRDGSCHNCEDYPEFLKEKITCTKGNFKKMRVGWTIEQQEILHFKEKSKLNRIFHFTIFFDGHPTKLLTKFFNTYLDTSVNIKISSSIELTRSVIKIDQPQDTQLYALNLTIKTAKPISQDTDINFSLENEELVSNSTHNYFLTKNSIDLKLTFMNNRGEVSSSLIEFASTGTKVIAVSAIVGNGFASFFQINFGVAFLKLFQIVEIFGKFYFIPLSFGTILDRILAEINEISDIMELDPNTVMENQRGSKRHYWNKLTINEEQKYMLQSLPMFTLASLILVSFNFLVIPTLKLNPKHRLISICSSLEFIVFGMSYIDFAFYGSYSLIGYFDPRDINIVANKALAFFLITYSLYIINKLYEVAQMDLRNPSEEMMAKFGTEIAYIGEGLKEECLDNIHPKLINTLFIFKGFFMMIPIISLQYMGTMCVGILTLFTIAGYVHFCWVLCKFKPYKNSMYKTQHIIIETAQTLFFIVATLFRCQEFYGDFNEGVSIALQIIIGVLIVFAIFCEVLLVISEPIYFAYKKLFKKEEKPENKQEKVAKKNPSVLKDNQLSSVAKYLKRKYGRGGSKQKGPEKKRKKSGWSQVKHQLINNRRNPRSQRSKKSINTKEKIQNHNRQNSIASPKRPRLEKLSLTKKLRMDRMRAVMKKPLKMVRAANMFKLAINDKKKRLAKFKKVDQSETKEEGKAV